LTKIFTVNRIHSSASPCFLFPFPFPVDFFPDFLRLLPVKPTVFFRLLPVKPTAFFACCGLNLPSFSPVAG